MAKDAVVRTGTPLPGRFHREMMMILPRKMTISHELSSNNWESTCMNQPINTGILDKECRFHQQQLRVNTAKW
jgi:hypothetical protein